MRLVNGLGLSGAQVISEMRERPQGVGWWKKGRSLEAVSRQYMHTQKKVDEVQFVITLAMATTKAENNNKDTSGGVTKRVRTSEGYYCEISMHDTV
jgi:hypothetical protein